jgi:hypothetical protein
MQDPIGRSFPFGLTPLGPLACSAEIDEVTHALFSFGRITLRPLRPRLIRSTSSKAHIGSDSGNRQ